MPEKWNFRLLLDQMASYGQAPAIIALKDGLLETVSFAELVSRVNAAARRLLQSDVQVGEPVALIGPNSLDWVVARLALGLVGAAALALDEFTTDAEFQTILAQCKATRAICDAAHTKIFCKSSPRLVSVSLESLSLPEGDGQSAASGALPPFSVGILPPNTPAMLAFTSGTTGTPKAVVLTESNLGTNVRVLVGSHLVGLGDRVLLPLPLYHVYPFVVGLLTPLGGGAAVVFPEGGTGPQILDAIRLARVTAIVGVPRLYSAICSGLISRIKTAGSIQLRLFNLLLSISLWLRRMTGLNLGRVVFSGLRKRFGSALRLLVSGGARLESSTLRTLVGLGFDVRSGYGLAETASLFSGNFPGHERWGSEGRPLAGDMRISAPDGIGRGEIQLRGPQVFERYLDNPQATRAAFTSDGWFRTGDMGQIDEDGFLYVSGRAGDVLVLGGGKKVDPEELEKVYGVSPYIKEIAIFERGGSLAALVVPSLEMTRIGGAIHIDTAIRIDLASRARTLPSYQRLAGLAITRDPLPRTRLGKYRRFLLPEIYERVLHPRSVAPAGPLSAEDQALLNNPVGRAAYEMLIARYPKGKLGLDASPLLDLGIDSLEWVSFGIALEDQLNVRLTESEIGSIVTVRDLLFTVTRGSAERVPQLGTREWISPLGWLMKFLGVVVYALDWLLMRIMFRLRIEGTWPDQTHGNFVLIANHSSYLDPAAIGAALNYSVLRKCYWAGDPTVLFSKRWQRPFMRAMQVYPLDERAPAEALATSEALLKRANNIIWFPEGWRTPDGALQPFLPGIGYLLQRIPVTVVPAYIDGTFEALPRDRTIPKLHAIRIRFGHPIFPADWQAVAGVAKNPAHAVAEFLHRAVENLRMV